MHENTLSCFRTVRNLWPSQHRYNVTPQLPSISVAEQILWIFINASSLFSFFAGVSWLVTWAFKQIAWLSENRAPEVARDKYFIFSLSYFGLKTHIVWSMKTMHTLSISLSYSTWLNSLWHAHHTWSPVMVDFMLMSIVSSCSILG